jgi:hypothetical protein
MLGVVGEGAVIASVVQRAAFGWVARRTAEVGIQELSVEGSERRVTCQGLVGVGAVRPAGGFQPSIKFNSFAIRMGWSRSSVRNDIRSR